jgi:hypothetical protein
LKDSETEASKPNQNPGAEKYVDKVNRWKIDHDYDPMPDQIIVESANLDRIATETANIPSMQTYQDFLSSSPPYGWLLARLERDCVLLPSMSDTMARINRTISERLPLSQKISKKQSPKACSMNFLLDWNPIHFLHEQVPGLDPGKAINTIITLTGTTNDAQAVTCGEYLRQTWPTIGQHTSRWLEMVASGTVGYQFQCK